VLFSHIFAAVAASALCCRLDIPYVMAAFGMEIQARRVQRFLPRAVSRSEGCIAISHSTAALLHEKGIPSESVALVGVGVRDYLLTAPRRRGDASRILQGRDGPVILTLARLDERYKGHDMMLQALPLIRARVPDVTYVVAGDGRYRRYYERLAAALGVGNDAIFVGRVTDEERLALYDRCDLFALISREAPDGGCEGFGIVFLEAAARGKPAVGGRSGGVPDAIVDGVTGLLAEPTDVDAIAGACVRLLTDRDLARRMGCSGRERVQDSFTWGHIALQVEGVLLHSAGHRAGGRAAA
jgi:phosphatidylinositol alpha-1,6-mannosyltransferase